MPGYRTHLVGGCAVYALAIGVAQIAHPTLSVALEWLVFVLLGSLFPDIDIKSKGQLVFYKFFFLLLLAAIIWGTTTFVSLLAVTSFIPLLVHHRGLFHRAWFLIALPFGIAFLCATYFPSCSAIVWWDALFFALGALSHIVLDMGFKGLLRV